MTTKLKLNQVSPTPPSESETTAALNNKVNTTTYNSDLNSVQGRLDSLEDNYVTTNTTQTLTGTKTLTSNLNLSPSSSSSNTGGQINFHYNQSENTTSSIVENASGQIRVNGNLSLSGAVTNGIRIKGGSPELYTGTDTSVNQTRDGIIVYGPDGSTRISTYRNVYYTDGAKELEIFTDNNGVYNSLRLTSASDGTRRCYLSYSPATNSNSTDIATTAYVKSNLSNYLPLSGGELTGGLSITNSIIDMKNTNITLGTAPSATHFSEVWFLHPSGASASLGFVGSTINSSNTVKTRLRVMRNSTTTKMADLGIGIDNDGNVFTEAPTPATTDNSTKIATTAYVKAQNYATLASPTLTGTPTAPTAAVSTNNTQIATTAFVKLAMSTWTAVTLTPVTTYCTSVTGNFAACYQNPYLKLCTVGFNLCLAATTIPSNTAIVTGFPKALHHFGCALCNGSINIRAYISTTGALMLDGAQTFSSTVWVDGSVTYPYSSL